MAPPLRSSANRFELLNPDQLEALPDLTWLIQDILPKPCLAVLYGDSGCGKTFVALSMALSVVSGDEWLGRPSEAADVLYIAAEGVLGLKSRVAAHRAMRGQITGKIRFLPGAPNFFDGDLEALEQTLETAGFRPGLIVVDTLARVTTGADENNAKDMGQAVAALDALRTAFDATVLVLHHKTKNGGSERGSSALRGAADVMIECRATETLEGRAVELDCTKMKDDEPFKNITAMMERVELSNGRSSLLVSHEVANSTSKGVKSEKQTLALLEEEFPEAGATFGELLEAFEAAKHGSKSTLVRALRRLKEAEKVKMIGKGKGAKYWAVGVSVTSVSD